VVLRDRLRQLREEAGLSVREAASRLGKSPGYLSRIEGRGEVPSADLLCEMASLYGANIEELLELAKIAQLDSKRLLIEHQQSEALRLFRRSQRES
jgi:transcriptional regulator with XRE-family HTH domain